MLTLALAASLAAMVAGGAALPPPVPLAVVRVPDEPGAIVLPDDEPTVQAVAADMDADGARELVRLVGTDGGPISTEVWRHGDDGWALAADPIAAVPGQAGQAELAYLRRPVRLLVRRVDGVERITLLRQPDFAEPEEPIECCLLLDDLVLSAGELTLVPVAEPGRVAGTLHVIDLDGDGTDELLATRALPPLEGGAFPTEVRVFRWADARFGAPTYTELPIGSGETPFIIGDSDGVAGDELAVISLVGRGALYRLSLGPGDSVRLEDAGLFAADALAVPLGVRRRGLAVVGPRVGLAIVSWPRGGAPRPPSASIPVDDARLVGVVDLGGAPRLLAHRPDWDLLHVLALPDLEPLPGGPIGPSLAAAGVGGGAPAPYVGPLPGGGLDGRSAAIVAGRLVPAPRLDDPAAPVGALADGRPVGLVGGDRSWLAIQHGALFVPQIDPAGGRLHPPVIHPAAVVTIAPLVAVATPEGNGGQFDPPTVGGVALGDGVTGVSRDGLVAQVRAPSGTRVYLPNFDQPGSPPVRLVGTGDALDVVVMPPPDATANVPGDVTMTVVTPAGHAYTSTWNLRIVEEPPGVSARAATRFGASRVTISGRTAPYAEVEVAGMPATVDEDGRFEASVELPPWPTSVTIIARDPLGNEASTVVSGVGILDYRGLPWILIALVLLAGIALALVLRVPHPPVAPRPIGDDAVLEELDPADRL